MNNIKNFRKSKKISQGKEGEMQEELISKNEYMRRYKVGLKRLNEMIYKQEVIMRGGKIVISKQTIPLEEYEAERERRIKAEQKLEIMTQRISNLLKEVS